ncbi:MAG: hypothetical protein OSB17_00335 [Ulvibacter sp.]|nr:hypothetical protein [Ulvibacter sp.]|tara:strand:- start:12744 stop:12881 length:138 start_codon:yes stop_codon:yes gene_type:complete
MLVKLDHEDRKLSTIAMAIKNPLIGINGFLKITYASISQGKYPYN